MSTPAPGVLSRRSHRRCMRIRCAPPVDSLSSHAASQEDLLRAEHDAPVHGHGRDQAVPGPAVPDSLEGRQASHQDRLPGKHSSRTSPARSRTRRTRARPSSSRSGTRSCGTARPLGRRAHWARHPLHLRLGRHSSDAAASAAPSSGSAGPSTSGHAADPPSADPLGGADMSLLQRAGVLQNTPYAA